MSATASTVEYLLDEEDLDAELIHECRESLDLSSSFLRTLQIRWVNAVPPLNPNHVYTYNCADMLMSCV